MATIAVGCRLIIFMETHNPDGQQLLCLVAKCCRLELQQTDRFLRPAHWETAVSWWCVLPTDKEGDLASLAREASRDPLKVAPDQTVSEASERWHCSLLNLKESSEDAAMDFSLSRMFLHLYPLWLFMASPSLIVSRSFPPFIFHGALSSPPQPTHLLIYVSTSVVLTSPWCTTKILFSPGSLPPRLLPWSFLQRGKAQWPHFWLLSIRISTELYKKKKLGGFSPDCPSEHCQRAALVPHRTSQLPERELWQVI